MSKPEEDKRDSPVVNSRLDIIIIISIGAWVSAWAWLQPGQPWIS